LLNHTPWESQLWIKIRNLIRKEKVIWAF